MTRLYCYLSQSDDVRAILRTMGSTEPISFISSNQQNYPMGSIFLHIVGHDESLPPGFWQRLIDQNVTTVAITKASRQTICPRLTEGWCTYPKCDCAVEVHEPKVRAVCSHPEHCEYPDCGCPMERK